MRLFIRRIEGRVRNRLRNKRRRGIGAGQFDAIPRRVVEIRQGFNRRRGFDVINAEQAVGVVVPIARDHAIGIREARSPAGIVIGQGHGL